MGRLLACWVALLGVVAIVTMARTPVAVTAVVPASLEMPPAQIPNAPVGTWLTANGQAVVRITPCGDALCGAIAGIARAPGDPMPTDVNGQPQCGLVILHDERPDGDGAWLGTVTDPRNGSSFGARLHVDDAGNLRLRGYLGIPLFGETSTWRPFTGTLGPECRMS